MKFLIAGAGAVGGYFGARLAESGEDVTFLVREGRREQLRKNGLKVCSPYGDINLNPKTIVKGEEGAFDVILIASKAYHLKSLLPDVSRFAEDKTVIVPLLNGMKHLEELFALFPKEQVLGGLCYIESTLSSEGNVIHTSPMHDLVFGEWDGQETEKAMSIIKAFQKSKVNVELSNSILKEMWNKYFFISAFSGLTSLYKTPIGPIREEGLNVIERLLSEIGEIMRASGAPIEDSSELKQLEKMMSMNAEMKSSMQRDMEKGSLIEGDHLQGYLLQLAKAKGISAPVLETIYTGLKIYDSDLKKSLS
ncbi:ketopantoate reductase family protein [Metabacillus sp. GX 13764]|uniref:ketopantoate reductase family protein n=1 Tax=Metabacillus kandeliae TaxID=2900151 RepID=UPI001E52C51E|nr:ketopantoate reductase family protein [Metabacillus kandeliae]